MAWLFFNQSGVFLLHLRQSWSMFYMTTGIHDPWCPEHVFFCVFAEENGSVAKADVNDTLQDV